jgi:gliding motility-associated-like protein
MRKILPALIAILFVQISYAQDFSNKGKEFWLCFPQHVPSGSAAKLSIWITSDKASSGTITMPNGAFSGTFNIAANGLAEIVIPNNASTRLLNTESTNGTTTLVLKKSIKVSVNPGQPPVVAYVQEFGAARSTATLLLPTNVLGKKYYAVSYTQRGSDNGIERARSQFQIIATKPNTVLNITPKKNGVLGTPFTVTLPLAGDMIQYQSADAATATQDLTGTLIESIASGTGGCLPVAVFSGSSNLAIGTQTNACVGSSYDPLFQQLYPVSTWGKNFGLIPFATYLNGVPYRIMASEDNTVVSIDGTPVATLNQGEFYPAGFTSNPATTTVPIYISADKPISVTEYMQSSGCAGHVGTAQDLIQGDPDMVVLNPTEQNISDITIFSTKQEVIRSQWVNILIKTAGVASFQISRNGGPLAAPTGTWQTFAALPGYSYLQQQLPVPGAGPNPTSDSYRLVSDSGFNAIAYGLGDNESYAYSAGTNVKDLYTSFGTFSQYGIEPGAVCTGSPFKIKISLPYKPDSIYWNLSGIVNTPQYGIEKLLPILPADTLLIDSVRTVNGKDVYWYSLPGFYTFNTVGVYTIPITIFSSNTEGCGNVQDKEFNLDVSNPPTANFTFNPPGCAAETVQFHDATVTVKPNYHWYYDFGDGSPISNAQDPTHLYAAGTYNVRFASITTPGCLSDTLTKQIIVPANPTATISVNATSVCQNGTPPVVTFTGTGGTTPYIFTYTINGGGPLTVTSNAVGIATVNAPTTVTGLFTYALTNVKNSVGTICTTNITGQSVAVTVKTLPTATISGTATVCQNGTAPTITFTGANGTAPYTFDYTINTVPQPSVTTTAGNSLTLTAPVTTAGTFTYAITGVSYGSPACVNPVTGQSALVTVNELPSAIISGTTELCLNATAPNITFTGTGGTAPYTFSYTINGGPAVLTVISTGSTATVPVPTGTAGTYIYALVSVESSSTTCSQAATGNATVKVNPQPTASFTAAGPYCKDKTVTFTPVGTVSSGTITSWVWDYGDGTGSHTLTTNAPFTVTYTTIGVKTATLKTISDKGCESPVATQTFTVSAGPVAGFIVPEVCLLDPFAQFTDTSKVDAPNNIITWAWNFGDPNATPGNPNTSSAPNATHTYSAVGPYTVGLTVTTAAGCSDFVQHTLVINGGNPVANFTVNSTSSCAADTTVITNKSTIASGSITKLEIYWDLLNNPTVFTTDDDPVFNGTYRHGYPILTTDQNYTIRVRAYSGGVCFSNKDMVITVHATPHAVFSAIPDVCLNNGTVQLTQGTETGGVAGPPGGVYSGTGVSSTGLFNPITAGVGTFTLKYKYTSSFGCVDSATQTIKVLQAPVAAFAPGTRSCAQDAITFTQSSTSTEGAIAQWIWNFGGADEVHTDGNPVTHTFATAGTYPVTLTVVTAGGCKSTVTSHNVVVNPNPVPSFAIGAPACLPAATITFTNTTPTASDNSYTWYFQYPALTPTSSGLNAQNIYTAAGPHTVRLIAANVLTSCTGFVDQIVNNIHLAPVASFDFSKPSICTDQSVAMIGAGSTGGDGSITTYTWNYGDGTPTGAGIASPAHTYSIPKTYDVTLTVENNFGCKDDSVRKFTVYPYPTVDAGDTHYVLEGGSTILQPTVTGTGLQYLWSANTSSTYLNSVIIKNPESHPLTDVTYTVLVTADGGCTASDAVMVKMLKFPEIPNTFTPNNDGIHDFWDINYLYTYPNNRVQVFTKTGQLVFESKGYSKPWDGTKNGKALPIDTYYYIIEPGYGRKPITGYVTILK